MTALASTINEIFCVVCVVCVAFGSRFSSSQQGLTCTMSWQRRGGSAVRQWDGEYDHTRQWCRPLGSREQVISASAGRQALGNKRFEHLHLQAARYQGTCDFLAKWSLGELHMPCASCILHHVVWHVRRANIHANTQVQTYMHMPT